MSIGSRLKIESMGLLSVSIFYIVTGIVNLGVLPFVNYMPVVGVIGILSLVTAYGLFRKRSWTLYPLIVLFFVVTVLALYMIYYVFLTDLLITTCMIVYVILTWIATAYTSNRRTKLES